MTLVHLLNKLLFFQLLWFHHLIERREVNTNSEAKHTKVLGNEEVLKRDNTKNHSDNTKEDDSENPKKKFKDISKAAKETYD